MMNPQGRSEERRCSGDSQDMGIEKCSTAGASLSCWYTNAVAANPKIVELSGCFK
jgi:hypothetical protein